LSELPGWALYHFFQFVFCTAALAVIHIHLNSSLIDFETISLSLTFLVEVQTGKGMLELLKIVYNRNSIPLDKCVGTGDRL